MWARNLGNLMMSPLKPIEFLISLMVMSLIRLAIGVIPMTLLALFFFDFNFFAIGLPLIAFFCNLIFTSWSIGIFVSGLGAAQRAGRREHRLDADVRPDAARLHLLSGQSVLPHWLQYLAWTLPPTYVFEGMRALLIDHVFRADLMAVVARHQRGAALSRHLRSFLPFCAAPSATDRCSGWRISHDFPWISGVFGVCPHDIYRSVH